MKNLFALALVLIFFKTNAQVDKKLLQQKVSEKSESSNFDSIVKALGYKEGDELLVWTIFTINKEGKIIDIKARGPHPILEKEAIRILESTPEIVPENFKPTEEEPRFSLPITFVIESDKQKAKRLKRENRKSEKLME